MKRFVFTLIAIYGYGFVATGVALDRHYGQNVPLHMMAAFVWPVWVPPIILERQIEISLGHEEASHG